jgi:ABC-type sugar transport system permease subunit
MGEASSVIRETKVPAQPHQPDTAMGWRWLDRQFARIAVLPTALAMLAIFGIPLAFSLYLSTEGWSADETLFGGRFAGIANYLVLLTDPDFIASLLLTLGYTAAMVAAELRWGLASPCCSTSICR